MEDRYILTVDYSMTGGNKLGFLSQNIFFSDNISFLMLNKDYKDYFNMILFYYST